MYLVLCAHADRDWCARVGVRRIAKLTGLQIGSVSRSLGELVKAGLITVVNPGKGSRHTYRIIANRSRTGEQPDAQTVCASVNSSDAECSRAGAPSVHTPEQNRSRRREQNRRTEELTEQQTAAGAVSLKTGDADPAILNALIAAGIGEPNRSTLAASPDLTQVMVRDAVEHVGERGGTGLVVNEIRARVEQARATRERDDRHRRAEQARDADRAAKREAEQRSIERDRAENLAVLEEIPPADLRRIQNAVTTSDVARSEDPRKRPAVVAAIVRYWNAEQAVASAQTGAVA